MFDGNSGNENGRYFLELMASLSEWLEKGKSDNICVEIGLGLTVFHSVGIMTSDAFSRAFFVLIRLSSIEKQSSKYI
jgi:hypothetical protein